MDIEPRVQRSFVREIMMTERDEADIGIDEPLAIAWCGWQIQVPADWRPLKISGELSKGSMMLGDAENPILSIQWRRVDDGRFDAKRWITKRFKKLKATLTADAPRPKGITAAAWARAVHVREGESEDVWYGYSSSGGMIVEVLTVDVGQKNMPEGAFDDVLASLRVTSRNSPCRWAMYGISFMSPPGFDMVKSHLFSGDIALAFKKGRKEELLLRQVYPAGMAVSRRSLDRWIDKPPFITRRRPVKDHSQEWRKGKLDGRHRRGWRRLPSPMGWCNPRYSTSVAAVDKKLDRLLIVEHLARRQHSDDDAEWCVKKMNG